MMPHVQELQDVIHRLHAGTTATHHESVPITEKFKGQTVWDGTVEVFNLKGHPKTNRIYGWTHQTDDAKNPKRHVTVLHIPPVVSARTAVQAAIAQEFKERARVN